MSHIGSGGAEELGYQALCQSDRLILVAGLDAGTVLLGGEVFDFEVLSSGVGAVLS